MYYVIAKEGGRGGQPEINLSEIVSEYGSGTAIFQTEKIQKHPNKIHTSLMWERGWHVLVGAASILPR